MCSGTIYLPLCKILSVIGLEQNSDVAMLMPKQYSDCSIRPDLLVYLQGLGAKSAFCYGEWKPGAYDNFQQHPDFLKLAIEMRLGIQRSLQGPFRRVDAGDVA